MSELDYFKRIVRRGFKRAWKGLGFPRIIIPALPTIIIQLIRTNKPINFSTLFEYNPIEWLTFFLISCALWVLLCCIIEKWLLFKELINKVSDFENISMDPNISFEIEIKCSERDGCLINHHAFLIIRNNEAHLIKNCKVYLDRIYCFPDDDFQNPIDVSNKSNLPCRLKWRVTEFANEKCEVDIEARFLKTLEILKVQETHVDIITCENKIGGFGFNQIELRILGDIEGTTFEKKFIGYFYSKLISEVMEGKTRKFYNTEFLFVDAERVPEIRFKNIAKLFINNNDAELKRDFDKKDFLITLRRFNNELTIDKVIPTITNTR